MYTITSVYLLLISEMLETDRVNVNAKSRRIFNHFGSRYVEILESNDLMQEHWNCECSRHKTDFGHIRIIQQAWIN
nr:6027_t:CDS:2 [Entrophospora candida]